MKRASLFSLLILLLSVLCPAAPADAQQNPLLGGQESTSPDEPPATTAAKGGLLHDLERDVVLAQAYFARNIDRQLVAIRDGHGLPVILGGLLIAFLYGVFHALGPGHGKTVIVGYFLGRGGSLRRGLAMASWISFSHVIGAIVIVGIAHFVFSRTLLTPVEESWWLRLASYGAILGIGLLMLARALLGRGHSHGHGELCGHHHSRRGELQLLAVAAGFLPCSGAVLILLFAFGNGILGIGILMTLTIALGMGLTLAALGIASQLTHRHAVARFAATHRPEMLLSLLGPILICAIGAILFGGTLLEMGTS
jgi:ABC-type nickel/cobalt efflux system permease component RcnA